MTQQLNRNLDNVVINDLFPKSSYQYVNTAVWIPSFTLKNVSKRGLNEYIRSLVFKDYLSKLDPSSEEFVTLNQILDKHEAQSQSHGKAIELLESNAYKVKTRLKRQTVTH